MKNLITILLLLVVCTVAKGQDQIITKAGDTINCKITRISSDYIHFEIDDSTGPIRSRIEKDKVMSYFQKEITVNTILDENSQVIPPSEFNESGYLGAFRYTLNSGFTYQYDGYENFPTNYTRQLRSLWSIGGEAHYFVSSRIGVGLKANHARTKTELDSLNGLRNLAENIRYNYIAASMIFRLTSLERKNILYFGISGGMVFYRDNGTTSQLFFVEEGQTFGLDINVAYDLILRESFGIGLNIGANFAKLDHITVNGINSSVFAPDESFGISRIDFTLGLRFYQYPTFLR
ncbi:MAG: hypothetical protein ABJG78_18910 [Cyclobacteriaceae bacterium]